LKAIVENLLFLDIKSFPAIYYLEINAMKSAVFIKQIHSLQQVTFFFYCFTSFQQYTPWFCI